MSTRPCRIYFPPGGDIDAERAKRNAPSHVLRRGSWIDEDAECAARIVEALCETYGADLVKALAHDVLRRERGQ